MHKLPLIAIGHSVGFTLPLEVVSKLQLESREYVFLADTSDGYLLTTKDPVQEQLEIGRKIMRERQGVLRELAKK
jgi:hypothetical protein